MKKIILIVGISTIFCLGNHISVYAGENVELTSDHELTISNTNLGSEFNGMAPGETRSQSIVLVNHNTNTADFYMDTETMKALEDANQTAGGAYSMKVELKEPNGRRTLYDSALGGTKTDAGGYIESRQGLLELNSSELGTNTTYLTTLPSGETAELFLTIGLDGESFRNTYKLSEGILGLQFFAAYREPATGQIVTVNKVVTQSSVPVRNIVQTFKQVVIGVKTGDTTSVGIFVVIMAAGIGLLFLSGKKKMGIKILAVLLSGSFLTAAGAVPTEAAVGSKTYTIRIYAGNVGIFSDQCKKEWSAKGASVTDSYMELHLSQGAALPSLPSNSNGYITYRKADQGKYYILENAYSFSKNKEEIVSRSETVTVQYGRLLDGTEYVIKYIEQGTGAEIALPVIAYGEAGTDITANAIDIAGYTLASASSGSIKLVKDGSNVITFEYVSNGREPTYTEITSTELIDGGITTEYMETEVPTYIVTSTVVGGAAADVAEMPAEADAEEGIAEAVPETGADTAANTGADDGVVIPEGEIPLDGIPAVEDSENETEEKVIEESDIPLFSPPFAEYEVWTWMIVTIGIILIIVGGIGFAIRFRGKK